MTRNLKLVLATALVFGVVTGVYEFVLPLFLRANRIEYTQLGIVFALAGLAMVVTRIYMGGLSDQWGRKPLYGWALALCGVATGLTPFFPALVGQLLLKTLRETAALTRETLHPIVLYEERQSGFLNLIGKFRGIEFIFQGGGTLLAGAVIAVTAQEIATYRGLLLGSGVLLLLASGVWVMRFIEHRVPEPGKVVRLRELLNLDLHPNLRLIALSGVIFTFGFMLSHSFALPLFFKEHFHRGDGTVSIIMTAHRLTIALPMLLVGNLKLKNLRAWYIGTMLIEGITMGASALIPVFWLSAAVFLLHDFIGAGIWSPIQAMLIQRYSRDANRGLEVGKVLAWGGLGAVIGPLVSGYLAERNIILPFLFSGIVMAASAIPLCWLNLRAPAPAVPAPTPGG